jgi:hypothetical protein
MPFGIACAAGAVSATPLITAKAANAYFNVMMKALLELRGQGCASKFQKMRRHSDVSNI